MANIWEIAQAWYRSWDPTPEQAAVAEQRLAICTTCEWNQLFRRGPVCTACGCPIYKKIFVSDAASCPHQKWPA